MNTLGPPGNASARLVTGRSAEKNADAKLLRAKSSRVNNSYISPALTFWRTAPGAGIKSAATSIRCCVACHAQVTNRNLGGHARRSALSGRVWCLQCADGGSTP
jgi:hypothetical protein